MIPWVHLVGAYLFIGTLSSGLGLLARLRWQGYDGEFFPKNPKGKMFFGVGIAIGVLFWPLVLLLIPVFRYFIRRRTNRILGHCEHATSFAPFCEACSQEQKKKEPHSYLTHAAARKKLAQIQRRIDERVKAGILLPPAARAPAVPPVPQASLEALKRKLQELQDARPETPVGFVCTRCSLPWPGFPKTVDAQHKAVCEECAKKGL